MFYKDPRTQAPLEKHRLKAFQGLTISLSGLTVHEKRAYGNLITSHGGVNSPELTKGCSHLVCKTATGEKYKCATHPESCARLKLWRSLYNYSLPDKDTCTYLHFTPEGMARQCSATLYANC